MNTPETTKPTTVVWKGQTPAGYSLLIETEPDGHWTATVAGVIRSRHTSLETAIVEAAGPAAPRVWASNLASALLDRRTTRSTQT